MSDSELCGEVKNDGERCDYVAKYDDGKCGIHSDLANNPRGGRESKFGDVKDDILDAADGYLNHEQVANAGGVSKQTLYNYFDQHEQFFDSFKRVRAQAANELIERGMDPDDDVDMKFVQFLLERSFKFIKTERQELEHSGEVDGFNFVIDYRDGGD